MFGVSEDALVFGVSEDFQLPLLHGYGQVRRMQDRLLQGKAGWWHHRLQRTVPAGEAASPA